MRTNEMDLYYERVAGIRYYGCSDLYLAVTGSIISFLGWSLLIMSAAEWVGGLTISCGFLFYFLGNAIWLQQTHPSQRSNSNALYVSRYIHIAKFVPLLGLNAAGVLLIFDEMRYWALHTYLWCFVMLLVVNLMQVILINKYVSTAFLYTNRVIPYYMHDMGCGFFIVACIICIYRHNNAINSRNAFLAATQTKNYGLSDNWATFLDIVHEFGVFSFELIPLSAYLCFLAGAVFFILSAATETHYYDEYSATINKVGSPHNVIYETQDFYGDNKNNLNKPPVASAQQSQEYAYTQQLAYPYTQQPQDPYTQHTNKPPHLNVPEYFFDEQNNKRDNFNISLRSSENPYL